MLSFPTLKFANKLYPRSKSEDERSPSTADLERDDARRGRCLLLFSRQTMYRADRVNIRVERRASSISPLVDFFYFSLIRVEQRNGKKEVRGVLSTVICRNAHVLLSFGCRFTCRRAAGARVNLAGENLA